MALATPTVAAQVNNTTSATVFTTASFTPSGNALLVVVGVFGSSSANNKTPVSCSSTHSPALTWTKQVEINQQGATSSSATSCIFTAITSATPGAGTVSLTISNSASRNTMAVIEVASGYNATTPVKQSKTSSNTNSTTLAVTLDATPDTDSMVIGGFAEKGDSTTTPPGAMTSLVTTTGGSSTRYVGYDLDSASATFTYSDITASAENPATWAVVEIDAASTGAYTLTAALGTYTLTGVAATPKAARLLTAALGTYVLTGVAASPLYGRKLTAGLGAYVLTGLDINVITSRFAAGTGTYAVTGNASGLLVARLLTAGAGSYALTGVAAGLRTGRKLTAALGTYALTGQAAAPLLQRLLTAAQGQYALTGVAAGLSATRYLAAAVGAYTLSGSALGIYVFGAYVDVGRTYVIIPESRTYLIRPRVDMQVAIEDRTYLVRPESRTYVIPAQDRTTEI